MKIPESILRALGHPPVGEDGRLILPKGKPPVRGLGDVVAKVAQPVAKAIDAVAGTNLQNCGGCKARQEKLNQIAPL